MRMRVASCQSSRLTLDEALRDAAAGDEFHDQVTDAAFLIDRVNVTTLG